MTKRTAAPLHRELPWLGFADDGVVMTKCGELLAGARLTGASFECRSAADLEYVSLRWTRALKSLVPGWRIRWLVCKRRLDSLPQRVPTDPLAESARRVRRDHLLDKGLYSIETYVFWTWDPKLAPAPAAGAGTVSAATLLSRAALWLSLERTKQVLASHVDAARVRFESAVASFCGLVNDVTALKALRGEDLFRALALSANSRSTASEARSVSPHGLDRQLALSDIEGYRDHLLLDAERVETYALLDSPAASRAHLFGEILDLDAELDPACEWSREDTAKSRRRPSSARRHYHQKRYSMLAHASAGDAPPQAQGALEDRAAQAEAVQLGEALRELRHVQFGGAAKRARWSDSSLRRIASPVRMSAGFVQCDRGRSRSRVESRWQYFSSVPTRDANRRQTLLPSVCPSEPTPEPCRLATSMETDQRISWWPEPTPRAYRSC